MKNRETHPSKRAGIAGVMAAAALVELVVAAGYRALRWSADGTAPPPAATPPAAPLPAERGAAPAAPEEHQGFLYGRVTTTDGALYEGCLRWGGDEETFWSDHFNSAKGENRWAAHVAPERLTERVPIKVFGLRLGTWKRRIDLDRPFVARFGDLARIDADGRDLRVTSKNGAVVHLDRYGADDFADGLQIWDPRHGVVDLDERRLRSVELLPTPALVAVPTRLHGTVHTARGDFTGFIQWSRQAYVGSDRLGGQRIEGEAGLRFDAIRSIARLPDGYRVETSDGTRIDHSGSPAAGERSPAASPPATADASPAGWSTTSTRARPPRRSTPRGRACTIRSPSAGWPRSFPTAAREEVSG